MFYDSYQSIKDLPFISQNNLVNLRPICVQIKTFHSNIGQWKLYAYLRTFILFKTFTLLNIKYLFIILYYLKLSYYLFA